MKEVYLDNSSTTKISDSVVQKILNVVNKTHGNASSLHKKGFEAELEIENAREIIAKTINARSDEIFFTSGGTESNNLAIFGTVTSLKKRGNKIVTTVIEHPSVYNSIKELEKSGYEVVYLKPDILGNLKEKQLECFIDESTILVSIMLVNNEIGSILPVEKVKAVIKKKKSPAFLHVDAVQAFGKIPIDVQALGVDLLSISSHKVHGPKGVGALYVRKGVNLVPLIYGGGQQKNIRPGTEPVGLIAGFGAAVAKFKLKRDFEKVKELNQYSREKLSPIDGICVNSPGNALPYILNFSTNKVKSETMLHYLSSNGVYVSSGSACAKGKKSRVLKELGLTDKAIDTAIRVSFSNESEKEDVDLLISFLKTGLERLAKI